MSLHLFLNDVVHAATVKALGGIVPQRAVPFNGINVRLDGDGRVYYEVKNEKGPWETMIPLPLKEYVEHVSWWVTLPETCPTRTVGRYEHETAEAIVDYHPDNEEFRTVRINGPDIEQVYLLYYQIRSGTAQLVECWQANGTDDSGAPTYSGPPLRPVKFACQSCGAKYTIAGEKIVGRTVKMRCKKCGEPITVTSDGVVPKKDEGRPAGQLHLVKTEPDKSN
ncbi:MAG: zinc-ribbon domain-containing protein [Patescibacteria group bacterium]